MTQHRTANLAGEAAGDAAAETLDWASFGAARAAGEFCQCWLQLQCRLVPRTAAGIVLLEDGERTFAPVATWPPELEDIATLVPAAERALQERQGVVLRKADGIARIAYPLVIRGELAGVVALEVACDAGRGGEASLQRALRQLHWGTGWLETLFHRRAAEQDGLRLDAAQFALDMVAVASAGSFVEATGAVATELAVRLSCRRVAVGVVRRGQVRVAALSHTSVFGRRLRLSDSLANAMEEAVDQDATVAWPPVPGTERRVAVAQGDHARTERMTGILTIVLRHELRPSAVILLERDDGVAFDPRNVALAEAVASLLGPVLALQHRLDRPLAGNAPRMLGRAARSVLGRRQPTAKLVALALAAGMAWLLLATGTDRITGKALLEGEELRAAVAPFDSFVVSAPRRAGEDVQAGDVLATLDTRELELEALRFEGQRDQALLKARDAEGKHDRTEAGIALAAADEASAQLAGARFKIAHAVLRAPFAGVIVSGDLSQQLDAPVERGKVLFEVAPLGRYRVVVQADEREIARLEPGMRGHLLLNGLSDETLDFTVRRVVPVAVAADGRNTFRVEGTLDSDHPRLRPGMEGVGKVVVGDARLAWVYGHPIMDWLRLALWKQLP